jgi:glycosyltransferase involved in cell wall biosynthesis
MSEPLISICIPAYNKPQYVARCLESILKQDYKSVEVIISDDSPDEDIKQVIEPYAGKLRISYYHNNPALKSPRNWNAALDKAAGKYVILLHQDDWLHSDKCLSSFLLAFEGEEIDFVFCRNTAMDENGKIFVLQARPQLLSKLSTRPDHLILAQVIGPPSNTMLKSSIKLRYDENFIWMVDVDYYNRILKSGFKYKYINEHLVTIGLHGDQTTEFCRTHPEIIFKENIMLAQKIGSKLFQDILLFDYYWRLLRNHLVRNLADIEKFGLQIKDIPLAIVHMLNSQGKLSLSVLKNGFKSKFYMLSSFLMWKFK